MPYDQPNEYTHEWLCLYQRQTPRLEVGEGRNITGCMAESRDMKVDPDRLRSSGVPGDLAKIASDDRRLLPSWKANAHVHLPPNFSAFDSVAQAVSLAARQGVLVLGASNYYDFGVYACLAAEGRRHGVFPLFGLEIIVLLENLQRAGVLINDPGNPGRMYICGKGIARFDPMTASAQGLMAEIRQNDSLRMRKMIERLERVFTAHALETGLDETRILDAIVRRYKVQPAQVCLQERHVAQAFQEAFFGLVAPEQRSSRLSGALGVPSKAGPSDAVRAQNEIRSHLMKVGKPAFVPEKFVNFQQASRLILELGGVPCYPVLADGAVPICPYEDPPEQLVEFLKQNRIYCAEFIPIRNRPEILERYVRAVRGAGLVVMAGTEHNTLDLIPLEPRCVGNTPIPEGIRDLFQEGICVAAAHQHLVSQARCGYVDSDGALNPEFDNNENRINFFRRLGAAVIAGYHEQSSH